MSKTIQSHCDDRTLSQWLSYLETIHSQEIDLGLGRIAEVATRLNIDLSFAKVITVAGTNGKGTTCAFIENYLLQAQHSIAVYSSPHIERFNERLRMNHQEVADKPWIRALQRVEQAREDISLTYYEFTTLAAFIVLIELRPEFIILEVGLGGRLDATNIIDADIAVLTTVDLDHQAFLGSTRELIGREKAGIFRHGRPAVIGDLDIPNSVIDYATSIDAKQVIRNKDFVISHAENERWSWIGTKSQLELLSPTHIPQNNVATALAALEQLSFELCSEDINQIIEQTKVPGRTELFQLECDVMLDVGHNPQAARYLAELLRNRNYPKVRAVVGMLKDKDIKSTLQEIQSEIDIWYFGTLPGARAEAAENIADQVQALSITGNCFDNVSQAFTMAKQDASSDELILVFGSFFTVAEIRALLIPITSE